MRSNKHHLSALTLAIAMSFGISAMAADMPKEGEYKGTYAGEVRSKLTLSTRIEY